MTIVFTCSVSKTLVRKRSKMSLLRSPVQRKQTQELLRQLEMQGLLAAVPRQSNILSQRLKNWLRQRKMLRRAGSLIKLRCY